MVGLLGGAKLEAALNEIGKKVSRATAVRVGFLEGATYPDGTSVPMVMAIQEFGAPRAHIPARPYFRPMIQEKSKEWGPALAGQLKANNYDVPRSLAILGEGIKGQLQQSIRDTDQPPLAASTIARKGFDKPLIDTGHAINSVGVEVVEQ